MTIKFERIGTAAITAVGLGLFANLLITKEQQMPIKEDKLNVLSAQATETARLRDKFIGQYPSFKTEMDKLNIDVNTPFSSHKILEINLLADKFVANCHQLPAHWSQHLASVFSQSTEVASVIDRTVGVEGKETYTAIVADKNFFSVHRKYTNESYTLSLTCV